MTFNNYRPNFQSGGQLHSPSSMYNSGGGGGLSGTQECLNNQTFIKMIPIINKNFSINTNTSITNLNNNCTNNRPLSMTTCPNQRFSLINFGGNLINKIGLETSSKITNNGTSRIAFNKKNGFASTFTIDEKSTTISTRPQQQQTLQEQRPNCFNGSNYDLRFTTMTPQRNIITRVDLNRINLKSLPAPATLTTPTLPSPMTTTIKSQQSDDYSSVYGEDSITNTSSESSSIGGGVGLGEEGIGYNIRKIDEITTNQLKNQNYHKSLCIVPKSLSQQPLNNNNNNNNTVVNRQRSSSSTRNRHSIISNNSNNSLNGPINCSSKRTKGDLQIDLNRKLANLRIIENDSNKRRINNTKLFRSQLIRNENSTSKQQQQAKPLQSSDTNAVKIRFESREPSLSKRFSMAASSTPSINRREHRNETDLENFLEHTATTSVTNAPLAGYDENSSSDSLKNSAAKKLYRKPVSLYYDSGIGNDIVSLKNFHSTNSKIKEEIQQLPRQYQTNSHNDITALKTTSSTIKKSIKGADTLNPSMIRKLYSSTTINRVKSNNPNNISNKSKLNSSSSTSDSSSSTTMGTSSSSAGLSSSSILSERVRHKLDSMLKSNNLKIISISKSKKVASVNEEEATKSNNDSRKNILIDIKKEGSSNSSYRKLNSCSDLIKSSTSTSSNTTHQILIESDVVAIHKKSNESLNDKSRADFTPTISRNPIISKAHLLKRKLGMPPPPIINSNTSIGVQDVKEKSCPSPMSILNSSYTNLGSSCAVLNSNYDVTEALSILSNKTKDTLTQNFKKHSMSTRNLFVANFFNNKNVRLRKKFESTNSINYSQQKSNVNLSISNESYYSPNQNNLKSESPNSNESKQNLVNISSNISDLSKICIATNDYIALYSRNLSLKKGERYTILQKSNSNWYLVRDKTGNSGFVPSKYLDAVYESLYSKDDSHYGHNWFHQNLTRSQAYILLISSKSENGTFLVRNNSSEKGKYTLSIYKNGKVFNYKINSQDNKLFIAQKHKFENLKKLIEFYTENPAGLVCSLKYPAVVKPFKKSDSFENFDSIYKKFTVERKDIEFFEKIGSGQFGVVLKAEYKNRKIVAVKKMKPGSKDDEINFSREAEFMMKLQNLQENQHKNLLQFFGVSRDVDDSILIVTEFVKYGSLFNYLLKHKERIANSKSRYSRLIHICIDVCDGMEYLESQNVIHRDLATRNCLVGEGEVIKVADFGLARFTESSYIAHPQSQFPVKWSAPEVIKHRSYSNKSDCWSFGCLMYEVFTLGKMPYGSNTTNSIAAKQIITGILPEKPIYCPSSLYDNLMIKLWNKEPKERPTFKEILKYLENLLK